MKIRIDIDSIKKLIELNISFKTIINYMLECSSICNKLNINRLKLALYIDKELYNKVFLKKTDKELYEFLNVNKILIKKIVDNNLFYNFTLCNEQQNLIVFLKYLDTINDTKHIIDIINKLESLNLTSIYYTTENLDKLYHTIISTNGKYINIGDIISDGEKTYINQFYTSSYPFLLKNANFILSYNKNNNLFCRHSSADMILRNFNFSVDDLPTLEYITDLNIEPKINKDDIFKKTIFIDNLYDINTYIDSIKQNILELTSYKSKLTENEYLLFSKTNNIYSKKIEELLTLKQQYLNKSNIYNLNEELINIGLKYKKDMIESSKIDYD